MIWSELLLLAFLTPIAGDRSDRARRLVCRIVCVVRGELGCSLAEAWQVVRQAQQMAA